eukprot:4663872-Prymnesium_polylepis.2
MRLRDAHPAPSRASMAGDLLPPMERQDRTRMSIALLIHVHEGGVLVTYLARDARCLPPSTLPPTRGTPNGAEARGSQGPAPERSIICRPWHRPR